MYRAFSCMMCFQLFFYHIHLYCLDLFVCSVTEYRFYNYFHARAFSFKRILFSSVMNVNIICFFFFSHPFWRERRGEGVKLKTTMAFLA